MEYDIEKISNKIKNKRMTKKIFKYIILNILIILFIINLILSFEEDTHIFGIYAFNIVSESMEPELNKNDVVVVRKCDPSTLEIGDIITFKQEEKTISHRIKEIIKYDKNNIKYITKGDSNPIVDPDVVEIGQIYGKVWFKVNKIGNLVEYIQNVRGFINVGIFIVIIFILASMKDKQKHERKMTRKKYEIKKMRDNYNL